MFKRDFYSYFICWTCPEENMFGDCVVHFDLPLTSQDMDELKKSIKEARGKTSDITIFNIFLLAPKREEKKS